MTTQVSRKSVGGEPSNLGPNLVALAGFGFVGYGILFIILNFTQLFELGLGDEIGMLTAGEVEATSIDLYHYISHVQIATGAFIIAVGLMVAALAWFGIRAGQRWAYWTAVIAPGLALLIALPPHYFWGFDNLGHLGIVYANVAVWLVGIVLAYRNVRA